MPFLTG